MEFTFTRATGEVAFFRSDAEQAEWTQEEMSLLCTFPIDQKKIIERGMIVLFKDPATDDWQAYEIRNCTILPGEYYQQFTAESLAISELTDCHIGDDIQFTSISVQSALQQVISGTGWNIGHVGSTNVSFGDIGRGSVWQGVTTIRNNWNVYIEPRVTVDASGITGRYLDILPSSGEWRGLRIAVNKNVSDPCVTYDDSELYTALYGYGASYSEGEREERQTLETNFSEVSWNETADHPAKPSGQMYIEYPEKTALYGRNGRPRFGYYQNGDIKDPETLLEKTWESLQQCCDPKISITGTVADLKRFGYSDQPLRLHDLVIVDIEPIGVQFYKQIIQLTVNLLDPTGNRPTIGDYIPNIIYINRETENYATGGGGGRGGGTRSKKKQGEFETNILQNERNIELNAKQIDNHGNILRQAGMYIDPITGVLIYAEDNENNIGSKFRVQSHRIEAEVTERKAQGELLSSRITQESNRITLEVAERKEQGDALSSRITITAREIRSEVTDTENRLNSSITQTATEIRTEVANSEAGLSSRITQNADNITAEVTRATTEEGNLSGRISVNADNITAEVTRATTEEGNLSGRITVNAEAVSAEVTRATSAEGTLSGRITVNSDKVSLVVTEKDGQNVVDAASIVAGVNGQTGSYVKIQAAKVNLDGYVTSSMLESAFTSAQQMSTQQMTISQYFTCLGYNTEWKSYSARFCSLGGEHTFKDTDGTSYTGRLVTGYTDSTIYYLGR